MREPDERLLALVDQQTRQKLAATVDPKTLEKAAGGDQSALQTAIRQILGTAEGRALAEKIGQTLKE